MTGTLTQSPNLLGSVFSESFFERYILYIQKEIVHGKEGGKKGGGKKRKNSQATYATEATGMPQGIA